MPARRSSVTTLSSTGGTKSANSVEPSVVRTPAVRLRSLIAVGTPNSGGSVAGSDLVSWSSASLARASASSPVTVTNAPSSALRRSIRSR